MPEPARSVGVRKAVAANDVAQPPEIPEATVWVDVDATELLETARRAEEGGPARHARACWPSSHGSSLPG